MHLSPRILKEAFKALAPQGKLTEGVIVGRGEKLRARAPEDFLVSRGAFMLGVMEANKAKVRRNAVALKDQFAAHGTEAVDVPAFNQLSAVWDSAIHADDLAKLHALATTESESAPVDVSGFEKVFCRYPAGSLSKLPLHVPELLYLFDAHEFEFDLLTGTKVVVTKTTKTITTKTTKKVVIGKKA